MAQTSTKSKRSRRRQAGVSVDVLQRLQEAREAVFDTLKLDLDPSLPVSVAGDDISHALEAHQVIVVAGETGSGKTTQLPKIAMALGRGKAGRIAHTQPRRLAARTVAKRIATEVGCELGQQVGYAVRFSDQVQDHTVLKVMTDGLLLTELRRDRDLRQYDTIIIDEAHERSLNIDYLLGYLKQLLPRRPDLKLIITSATIDVERFAQFFAPLTVPIVQVEGRSYPVELVYQELEDLSTPDQILKVIEQIEARPRGRAPDVLVFLSGEQEIFHVAKYLRRQAPGRFSVLPLYARLSFREQQKIFQPDGGLRRIVLATNVAETSLTVPNIGYVIDPGYARINRYSYRSKLQRLPIEAISQASANQRKGRCGRTAPGVCYRLYSETDFTGREAFTDPEIRRVNLASVVLQMEAFKLGRIQTFPFIDPPDPKAVKDALTLLRELRALDARGVTKLGRDMARLPIDPRLARMLVESNKQGALREALIVCSGLAVVDPRERPMQQREAADTAHEIFAHDRSDFLSLIRLWDWLEERRQDLSRNQFEKALRNRFLNSQRVREWRELHRQLRLVCRELGWRENSTPPSYAALHESLLSGCLSLIAQHDEKGHYLGARNLKLRIFPGSNLAAKTPRWIMAGEITETSRVYGRNIAFIEPGWLERQAQHLLKHHYSEPYWSAKRGEVLATQHSTLYGLRVVEGRRVSYSRIDPVVARDLFLRDGLVAGQVSRMPDFLSHNLEQVASILDLEAKGRRRDLLVSEDEIYAFYAKRLPDNITRLNELEKWLKGDASRSSLLQLSDAELMQAAKKGARETLAVDDFPGQLEHQGVTLKLSYRFAPGEKDDGVSVDVPASMLPAVSAEWLEWSVPGFLPLLIEQWLRTLPKSLRRSLVPLPERVDELCHHLLKDKHYRHGRLLSVLAELVKDRFSVAVKESDWDRSRVDEYLLPFVRVLDGNGKVLLSGRDLRALKARLHGQPDALQLTPGPDGQDQTRSTQGQLGKALGSLKLGLTVEFPSEALMEQVVVGSKHQPKVAYPGFAAEGNDVAVRLFDSRGEREAAQRAGYSALALQQLGNVGQYFRRELDKHKHLQLHFAAMGNAAELKQELLRNVVWFCYFERGELPQSQAEFNTRLEERRPQLATMFNEVTDKFAEVLAARFECVRLIESLSSPAYAESITSVQDHLQRLAPKDLLSQSSFAELSLRLYYLRGVAHRLRNLGGRVPKDRQLMQELNPLQARIEALSQAELYDQKTQHALQLLFFEVVTKEFAQGLKPQKFVPHVLDDVFGKGWKASQKKLNQLLQAEERRVGL